ncbi:MAG TPA: NAD(P)/FAD-dependent oxidoreductase [Lacipirellulaceae bacterium]|nr:NAD(P)/FAD-dependent oxidoreductase [Lacipirellulaceae bacterium]
MGDAWDVVVIGAGAAGLLAATRAAERGRRTLLVERNRKPGVKILMSGGTRCNLTHATDRRGIVEAFGAQGPFLHSALARLGPDELVAMFHAAGVPTKIESTGKVFPESDRAFDVLVALREMLEASGAELALDETVLAVERGADPEAAGFAVRTTDRTLHAEKVIVTVGGQSYPDCGTRGDGYAWAKSLGHTIVPPRPALAPLVSPDGWVHELRGVTVADVQVSVGPAGAKPTASRRGSFLFTHFGLSGPVAMDLSRVVTERPQAGQWQVLCDFVPALAGEALLARLAHEAAQSGKKSAINVVTEWAPRRLAEALFQRAGLPIERRIAELSRAGRTAIVAALKSTAISITGSLGFKKAEVTAGGVSLAEVDSRTMQSKLVPNLYFAGEILDLDGPIGGYNFQAAFSTGFLAGESV